MTPTPIDVSDPGQRHVHVDDTWNALVDWNEMEQPTPSLYLHGSQIVRVSRDEDSVRLVPYDRASLLDLLSRACRFFVFDKDGVPQSKPVPTYVADWLLARTPDQLPGALRLDRVVDVPVWGSDESLIERPGYHAGARAYFAPSDPAMAQMPKVGDWRTAEQLWMRPEEVKEAIELLRELICDFPFADPSSRAHALAMILEPFVREVIGDEPTPLYLVHAHQIGQGKGLLVETCLGVGCGYVKPSPFSASEEELRKSLTARLKYGEPVVFFDNVKVRVESPALAAALTAHRWSDRELGHSKLVDAKVRNVWVMTANNVNMDDDFVRRVVPIFLESEPDRDPRFRTDWHHPLPEWARENRADLVQAANTLVAHYLHGKHDEWSGEDVRTKVPQFLATYPSWSRVMGGILHEAGGRAFLGNMDKIVQVTAMDVEERGSFLARLDERFSDYATAKEWVGMIAGLAGPDGSTGTGEIDLPHELEPERGVLNAQILGAYFSRYEGALTDGYRVLRQPKRTRSNKEPTRWRVEKIGVSLARST